MWLKFLKKAEHYKNFLIILDVILTNFMCFNILEHSERLSNTSRIASEKKNARQIG